MLPEPDPQLELGILAERLRWLEKALSAATYTAVLSGLLAVMGFLNPGELGRLGSGLAAIVAVAALLYRYDIKKQVFRLTDRIANSCERRAIPVHSVLRAEAGSGFNPH